MDTVFVYVSATGDDAMCKGYRAGDLAGNDPFEPGGAVTACATFSQAYKKGYLMILNDDGEWVDEIPHVIEANYDDNDEPETMVIDGVIVWRAELITPIKTKVKIKVLD
jgi:hypothetical protein